MSRRQDYWPPESAFTRPSIRHLKVGDHDRAIVCGRLGCTGAKLFGCPTFWVNRQKQPQDQLDAIPDGEGTGLKDLFNFLPH